MPLDLLEKSHKRDCRIPMGEQTGLSAISAGNPGQAGAPGRKRRPVYTVVQVTNTFRVPGGLAEGRGRPADDVWAAYDQPQVTFQYYDGLNGELLYAESILAVSVDW